MGGNSRLSVTKFEAPRNAISNETAIWGSYDDSKPALIAVTRRNSMIWPFNRESIEPEPGDSDTAANEPLSLLAAVAQALPDPFLVLNRDGWVIISNRTAEEIIEMPLRGQHIAHAIRSPVILDALTEVMSNGEPLKVEFLHRFPLERRFEAFIAPLAKAQTTGNDRPAIIMLLRDLTREQQLERMRVDFVANASHELRTPLASLLGFIDTLEGPARNDEPARRRFLGLMRTQAERMARLIDDLLSLSRIELNAHRRPAGIVDLGLIVKQAAEMLSPAARAAGAELKLDLADDLTVQGDHDELMQVVQNLIENAIKYASSGRCINVAARRDMAGKVELTVEDFGPGIPPEHLPRLTERFYRVSVQESRARGGTGLGLAIVKHILNRHRAKLLIGSELGKGSRFTVRFASANGGKRP
jgi:two-component system, OmpR family, phosphate regulon sensor histidine kinase PhoR